ncbi:MAG: hypothetical protein JNM17_25755 [Archangium sp.]|nr:hypothetical protein [Archangium sp.]
MSVELEPGAVIGRLSSAAWNIADPGVSEAHAMVSLRRGRLWLLALRRRLEVEGRLLREVCLEPGVIVRLTETLELRVDDVVTPPRVLAVTATSIAPVPLAQVTSILGGQPPSVVSRFVPRAAVTLWSVGSGWRLQQLGNEPRDVGEGDSFVVDGLELRLVLIELQRANQTATTLGRANAAPLRLSPRGDDVAIDAEGCSVTLTGLGARLISELLRVRSPIAWQALARELWPSVESLELLRGRFDAALTRLRATLRDAGLRTDLVTGDGSGLIQLMLYAHDTVADVDPRT